MPTIDADAPLPIVITAAGKDYLTYRNLLRQAVPILQHPQQFAPACRARLVQTILDALNDATDVENVEDFQANGYGEGEDYDEG